MTKNGFNVLYTIVSPTIFKEKGYRFFFFSREEPRLHVHVICASGEAKYWIEPEIELAKNYRLTKSDLKMVEQIIKEHRVEIEKAWEKHFGS